jgi:ubiquinone/menaquinone biosynthesis C-methylase UbiE
VAAKPQDFFRSTVAHYARFRTGYPPERVRALAAIMGIDRDDTLLDIGCGTGQLTIPLAQYAETVIAIDPVPEMLATGADLARAAGTANIVWRHGNSSDLATLVLPGARAATFAASFHWTDRAQVVRDLDGLLAPSGCIVTINDVLDDAEEPDWVRAVAELRRTYLGDDHTASTDPYTHAAQSHRDILTASPFAQIQTLTWEWVRPLTIAEAVGLQFTYSFSTPEVFGDQAERFAADAQAVIERLHPDGRLTEPFRVEVLIASRR